MLLRFLFLVSLALLPLLAQDCSVQNSCSSCISNGCGWCVATQKCLKGDALGPNSESDKCFGAAWEWGKCTNCSTLTSCLDCLEYNADCFWCFGGTHPNQCVDASTNSTFCPAKVTNKYSCPCDYYSSCSDCVERSRGSCSWCKDKSKCMSSSDAEDCLLSLSCPCQDNKDCVSCQNDDGCGWCTINATCVSTVDAKCLIAHTCPTICQDYTNCGSCHADQGCKWCSELRACKPVSYATCARPLSCDIYCGLEKNCDVCNSLTGCIWCHDKCVFQADHPTCPIVHTCPGHSSSKSKKGGFDGGSFVGGMFLAFGLLIIGGIAWFIYKKKFSDRASYQELTGAVNKQ